MQIEEVIEIEKREREITHENEWNREKREVRERKTTKSKQGDWKRGRLEKGREGGGGRGKGMRGGGKVEVILHSLCMDSSCQQKLLGGGYPSLLLSSLSPISPPLSNPSSLHLPSFYRLQLENCCRKIEGREEREKDWHY